MPQNVHQIDRIIRVVLAVILAVVGVTQLGSSAILGILLIAVGGILLATAFMGSCPIYSAIGFSTNKKSS